MTIGSDKKATQTPQPGTETTGVDDNSLLDAMIRQMPEIERQRFLQKYSTPNLPAIVEDVPENKLAGVNYQNHGVSPFEFEFIQHYFSNGYNATQAYLAVSQECSYETAKANGYKMVHSPVVRNFIRVCFDRMGMDNNELERRIEAMIDVDPLDCFDIKKNKKGEEYLDINFTKMLESGASKLIKSIEMTRFGPKIQFVDRTKLVDIQTKVRGMQKKVSITTDLQKIAEWTGMEKDEVSDMYEVVKEAVRQEVVTRDDDVRFYYDDE